MPHYTIIYPMCMLGVGGGGGGGGAGYLNQKINRAVFVVGILKSAVKGSARETSQALITLITTFMIVLYSVNNI